MAKIIRIFLLILLLLANVSANLLPMNENQCFELEEEIESDCLTEGHSDFSEEDEDNDCTIRRISQFRLIATWRFPEDFKNFYVSNDEKYIVAAVINKFFDLNKNVKIIITDLNKNKTEVITFSNITQVSLIGIFGPENIIACTLNHNYVKIMSIDGSVQQSFSCGENGFLEFNKSKNHVPNQLKASLSYDQKIINLYNVNTGEYYLRRTLNELFDQKNMTPDGRYGLRVKHKEDKRYFEVINFDTGETEELIDKDTGFRNDKKFRITGSLTFDYNNFILTNDSNHVIYSSIEFFGKDASHSVKVLNLKTKKIIRKINTIAYKLAVDPNNKYIATYCDYVITIFDFASGYQLQKIKTDAVQEIKFSKNLLFVRKKDIQCGSKISMYALFPEKISNDSLTFGNYDLNFYFNKPSPRNK